MHSPYLDPFCGLLRQMGYAFQGQIRGGTYKSSVTFLWIVPETAKTVTLVDYRDRIPTDVFEQIFSQVPGETIGKMIGEALMAVSCDHNPKP